MVYSMPSLSPLSQLSVQCSVILLLDHIRAVYCVYSKASFLFKIFGMKESQSP